MAETDTLAQLDLLAWQAQYRNLNDAAALGQRLLSTSDAPVNVATGACHLAFALLRLGQREPGEAALVQAEQAALADGSLVALAACRNVRALLLRRERAPEQALQLLEKNLALVLPAYIRYVSHNLAALTCSELGRLDDALRHYLMARDEAQRCGDAAVLANASANLSGIQADVLNLEDAAALADEAIAAAESAGLQGDFMWLTACYNRCYTALAAGDGDLAMAVARRMRPYALRVPVAKRARYEQLWAGAAVASGHALEAARLLGQSRRRWRDGDDLLLEWSVVHAALDNHCGRFKRARLVCDAARTLTTSGGEQALPQDRMRLYQQGSLACEALGDDAAALAYARQAFEQYELIAGRSARARRITAEAQLLLESERRNREEAQRRRRVAEVEQQRLAELNAALLDANQAKTRFLAAASHDLRQPLHALALQAANLRHAVAPMPAAMAVAERLESSVLALSAMCDALLDISQIESGGLQPRRDAVLLRPLLLRLAEELQPQAESRGLRLALRLPSGVAALRVDTDPALLETMLRNLLANALKYTRQGGVLLALRRRHGQAGHWRLQVIDTGIGIDAASQQRVFEDFVQLGNAERQRSQGLGLGLAIVRRLSLLLNHPLSLRSQPGRGTCLSLQLCAASSHPAAAPADADLPALAGLRVAVVEDDPDAQRALLDLLQSWQVHATAFDDGQQFLQSLQMQADGTNSPPRLDALITDLRLPGTWDGMAIAHRVRARPLWAGLPVLVVSADTRPPQTPGVDWLAKPVRAAALQQWLSALRPLATR